MPETGSKRRPSRKLVWGVGLLALLMSAMTVLQVHHYGDTRPGVRDEAWGRTHAVRIHERTVFLTTGEYASALASHAMAIIAIGVFLGLLLKSRVKAAGTRNQTN